MDKDVEDEKGLEDKPVKKKGVKKSKEGDVLNKNTIEINPKINEAPMRVVVLGWGRMNPITSGHEILVNKIKEVAKKNGATPVIYLSQGQDAKKNPLSYEDKVMLAKKAFGNIIRRSKSRTIMQIMTELEDSYDKVILVAGDDRVAEFSKLLNKYNGSVYNISEIEVVSAGKRADPDSDAAKDMSPANMSASVMRKLASNGDLASFKKGLPKRLQSVAQDVYDLVRSGMKLAEMAEEDDQLIEVMNFQQRRARSLIMRKFKVKMANARRRLRSKAATVPKLKTRARKAAIKLIRKRVAGKKGENYNSLSPSAKMLVDKRVLKKRAAIDKIARRLLPMVRKADLLRLRSKSESFDVDFENFLKESTINESFELFLEAETKVPKYTKRYHQMYNKEGTIKLDGRFRAFRARKKTGDEEEVPLKEGPALDAVTDKHKDERIALQKRQKNEKADVRVREIRADAQEEFASDLELISFIESTADDIFDSVTLNEEKILESLQAKAQKADIEIELINHIYEEAIESYIESETMDIEQWAFSSVNVAIANMTEAKKSGLWDNIHKKRKRIKSGSNEKMRKPGTDGAPSEDDFENARKEEVEQVDKKIDEAFSDIFNERSPSEIAKFKVGSLVFKKQYKLALDALIKVLTRKRTVPVPGQRKPSVKHSISYYAAEIAKSYNHVDGKTLEKMLPKTFVFEDALEWGTDKSAKKYKKDTPGQTVNEAFNEMFAEDVTQSQLNDVEKFADRILSKFKVDIEFTRHFADRMNDPRNNPPITIADLQQVFKKIAKKKAMGIRQNPDSEAIIKDLQKDLNMPVVINYDKNKDEFEVVTKTIMRKKGFKSNDTVINTESIDEAYVPPYDVWHKLTGELSDAMKDAGDEMRKLSPGGEITPNEVKSSPKFKAAKAAYNKAKAANDKLLKSIPIKIRKEYQLKSRDSRRARG